MASSHRKLSATKPTPQEVIDKYSGVGVSFRVKFVGSEDISKDKGEVEARASLKAIRVAQQQLGYHKPKAVLGLSTKGLTLFDERTKANTRVAINKINYMTHDPESVCHFGVVVSTTESTTGSKLYAFKSERNVALQFTRSAQELFDVLFRIREAKKKIKERKQQEQAEAEEATKTAETTPAPKVVGGVEAPPDYKDAVLFSLQDDENPPPVPPRRSQDGGQPDAFQPQQQQQSQAPITVDDRRQKAVNEWAKLENELNDIAKDLNLDLSSDSQPKGDSNLFEDHVYAVPVKKSMNSEGQITNAQQPANSTWTSFEAIDSTPNTGPAPTVQQFISQELNPFSASTPFESAMPRDVSNPFNTSGAAQPSVTPNITMDMLNTVLPTPQPYQQAPIMSVQTGPVFYQPAPVTNPGFQPGAPMFQPQPQAAAPDFLSSNSNNFLAFSQPLQPAVIPSTTASENPPPKRADAFADLVNMFNVPKNTPPPPPKVKPEPPKPYVPMKSITKSPSDPFSNAPAPQAPTTSPATTLEPNQPPPTSGFDMPPLDVASGFNIPPIDAAFGQPTGTPSEGASGGFDDMFGSTTDTPTKTGWVNFGDDGQWL